jgi:hypothetical protein
MASNLTTLQLTEEQVSTVCKALEVYLDLCTGQVDVVTELVRDGVIPVGQARGEARKLASGWGLARLEALIGQAKRALRYSERGGIAASHPHVHPSARCVGAVMGKLTRHVGACQEADPKQNPMRIAAVA